MHKIVALAAVMSSGFVSPSTSQEFEIGNYLNQFDSNKNLLLEQNEVRLLQSDANLKFGHEESSVLAQLEILQKKYPAGGPIPILEFKQPPVRANCDDQLLLLRRNVTSIPFLKCQGFWPKASGASFAAVRNNLNSTTTAVIDGGLGLQIIPATKFNPVVADKDTGLLLVDAALLAFGEVDGTLANDGARNGYARYGLKSESLFEGVDRIDAIGLSLLGYQQINLATDQQALGIQASIAPHIADNRINTYVSLPDTKSDYFWKLVGTVDYFDEEASTAPALPSTTFGWAGGTVGFSYFDKEFGNGLKLDITADLFWDWERSHEAIKFTASADINLDKEGVFALGIDYEHGEDRNDQSPTDEVTVGLRVRF